MKTFGAKKNCIDNESLTESSSQDGINFRMNGAAFDKLCRDNSLLQNMSRDEYDEIRGKFEDGFADPIDAVNLLNSVNDNKEVDVKKVLIRFLFGSKFDESLKEDTSEYDKAKKAKRQERLKLYHRLFDKYDSQKYRDYYGDDYTRIESEIDTMFWLFANAENVFVVNDSSKVPNNTDDGQPIKYRFSAADVNIYADPYKEVIYAVAKDDVEEETESINEASAVLDRPIENRRGTIANVLKQHNDELRNIWDPTEYKNRVLEIVKNSDASEDEKERFVRIISEKNTRRPKDISDLYSTVAAFMTGITVSKRPRDNEAYVAQTKNELVESLKRTTNSFKVTEGKIKCKFDREAVISIKTLREHYSNVTHNVKNGWHYINYNNRLTERLHKDTEYIALEYDDLAYTVSRQNDVDDFDEAELEIRYTYNIPVDYIADFLSTELDRVVETSEVEELLDDTKIYNKVLEYFRSDAEEDASEHYDYSYSDYESDIEAARGDYEYDAWRESQWESLEKPIDEGIWDDIKTVGKAVGKEAKRVGKNWLNKKDGNKVGNFVRNAVKNTAQAVDKVKNSETTKNIGAAIKSTDTYKNNSNKGDTNRKPEDLIVKIDGKKYKMSDLDLVNKEGRSLGKDQIKVLAKYGKDQRKRILKKQSLKFEVPDGVQPIKEDLEEDIDMDESLVEEKRASISYDMANMIKDSAHLDYTNWNYTSFAFDEIGYELCISRHDGIVWKQIDVEEPTFYFNDFDSADEFVKKILYSIDEQRYPEFPEVDEYESNSVNPTELDNCPSCGGNRFNPKTGVCIDCGYDEGNWGYTETDDYDESLTEEFEDERQNESLNESMDKYSDELYELISWALASSRIHFNGDDTIVFNTAFIDDDKHKELYKDIVDFFKDKNVEIDIEVYPEYDEDTSRIHSDEYWIALNDSKTNESLEEALTVAYDDKTIQRMIKNLEKSIEDYKILMIEEPEDKEFWEEEIRECERQIAELLSYAPIDESVLYAKNLKEDKNNNALYNEDDDDVYAEDQHNYGESLTEDSNGKKSYNLWLLSMIDTTWKRIKYVEDPDELDLPKLLREYNNAEPHEGHLTYAEIAITDDDYEPNSRNVYKRYPAIEYESADKSFNIGDKVKEKWSNPYDSGTITAIKDKMYQVKWDYSDGEDVEWVYPDDIELYKEDIDESLNDDDDISGLLSLMTEDYQEDDTI